MTIVIGVERGVVPRLVSVPSSRATVDLRELETRREGA